MLFSPRLKCSLGCDQVNKFKPLNRTHDLCCDLCAPGQYMVQECTLFNATLCRDCPTGYYSERKNKNKECEKCSPACDQQADQVQMCTRLNNLICECPPGRFLAIDILLCKDCSLCPKGSIVEKVCTSRNDTKCKNCPKVRHLKWQKTNFFQFMTRDQFNKETTNFVLFAIIVVD